PAARIVPGDMQPMQGGPGSRRTIKRSLCLSIYGAGSIVPMRSSVISPHAPIRSPSRPYDADCRADPDWLGGRPMDDRVRSGGDRHLAARMGSAPTTSGTRRVAGARLHGHRGRVDWSNGVL